jgi:hypothetical protein
MFVSTHKSVRCYNPQNVTWMIASMLGTVYKGLAAHLLLQEPESFVMMLLCPHRVSLLPSSFAGGNIMCLVVFRVMTLCSVIAAYEHFREFPLWRWRNISLPKKIIGASVQITQSHDQDDRNTNIHNSENLKTWSYTYICIYIYIYIYIIIFLQITFLIFIFYY